MSGEQLIIASGDLPKFMAEIAEQVAARVSAQIQAPRLPQYYKFPEDIISMTGGHIPTGTILGWKTSGYLRTFKIGRRAFVKPTDWQWFLDNHSELMAAAPSNRGVKMARRKGLIQGGKSCGNSIGAV